MKDYTDKDRQQTLAWLKDNIESIRKRELSEYERIEKKIESIAGRTNILGLPSPWCGTIEPWELAIFVRKSSPQKDVKDDSMVSFTPEVLNGFLPEFANFFPDTQHNDIEAFFKRNKQPSQKFSFSGRANQLCELFKRMRYNKKLYAPTNTILSEWLRKYFSTSRGDLKSSTVDSVLKGVKYECAPDARLLTKQYAFKYTDERKKTK